MLLNSDNEPSIALVLSSNDTNVIALTKCLAKLRSLKIQRILPEPKREVKLARDTLEPKIKASVSHLEIFMLRLNSNFISVDGKNLSLQIRQLSLTHLYIVSSSKIMAFICLRLHVQFQTFN